MKKPKLLITLGCSLTEGVGCYDYSLLKGKDDLKRFIEVEGDDIINKVHLSNDKKLIESMNSFWRANLERFHFYGWPPLLAKKLKYDKVINLGLGAASTSGNLKSFIEKYNDVDLSKWDVLILWHLPEPTRFSFYIDYIIKDYFLHHQNSKLGESLFNEMNYPFAAALLEQIYHIKLMENICKANGYNFLWLATSTEVQKDLLKLHPTNNALKPIYNLYNFEILVGPEKHKEYFSSICKHPNEKGYEIIADRFFNLIKSNHPHLLGDSETLESIWNGKPITHSGKFIEDEVRHTTIF
jgi:hypothetical protein